MAGSAIVGIGTVVGGLIGADAAGDAAETQSDAMAAATQAEIDFAREALQMQIYYAAIAAGETEDYARKAAEAIATGNDEAIQALKDNFGWTVEDITKAGRLQRQALSGQADALWKMYNEGKRYVMPYQETGKWALGQLRKIMANPEMVKKLPGYQFGLDQGNKNILANASATGGIESGRTLKALQEYGQDYATNSYQSFLGNFFDLAGMGERASAGLANMAQQHGMNLANYHGARANSLWNEWAGKAEMQNALGTNLANIYSGSGKDIANILGQTGTNLANIWSGIGHSAAQSSYNIGNALASNYINQGNIWANAGVNQANIWSGAINDAFTWLGGSGWNPFGQQSVSYSPDGSYQNPQWL